MDQLHALSPRLIALLQDMPLEELAFVAVPVRARHDGWLKPRQQGFILRLALGGCVSLAAKAVGKTKASAYRLRARPGGESFAAAWDRALGWGRSRALDLGMERAIAGEEVPVMYRGRRVGTRQVHDNRLLIAVLNALGPIAPEPALCNDPNLAFGRALDAIAPDPAATENTSFSRGI